MLNNNHKKTWVLPKVTLISSGSGIIEGGGPHTSTEKTGHKVRHLTTFGGHATQDLGTAAFNSAHS